MKEAGHLVELFILISSLRVIFYKSQAGADSDHLRFHPFSHIVPNITEMNCVKQKSWISTFSPVSAQDSLWVFLKFYENDRN